MKELKIFDLSFVTKWIGFVFSYLVLEIDKTILNADFHRSSQSFECSRWPSDLRAILSVPITVPGARGGFEMKKPKRRKTKLTQEEQAEVHREVIQRRRRNTVLKNRIT